MSLGADQILAQKWSSGPWQSRRPPNPEGPLTSGRSLTTNPWRIPTKWYHLIHPMYDHQKKIEIMKKKKTQCLDHKVCPDHMAWKLPPSPPANPLYFTPPSKPSTIQFYPILLKNDAHLMCSAGSPPSLRLLVPHKAHGLASLPGATPVDREIGDSSRINL